MSAQFCRWWCTVVLLAAGSSIPGRTQGLFEASATGAALFAQGDYAAAEEAFTRELSLSPQQPSLLFNRATARFNQQKYEPAKRDLDAFLLLQPRSAQALSFRALLHLLLGAPRAAAVAADAALQLVPHDVEALTTRARARGALKQFDQALQDFNAVLSQRPDHPAALLGRGDLQLTRNELSSALADFSRAARAAPHDPEAQYRLSLVHFRQVELPAASVAAETAVRLAGGGSAERMLGMVHYAAGDFAGAAQSFQRAIATEDAGSLYTRFMLLLCERRLGRPVSPIPEAPAATANRAWAQLLRGFLLGQNTEDELFLGAENLVPPEGRSARLCEAYFYLGTVRLLEGDPQTALHSFQQAIEQDTPAYTEHTLARAELARIKPAAPAARPRPSRH